MSCAVGETAEMIAAEYELPEVAGLLREECLKFRNRQRDVEHRSSYEALRKYAISGDLSQFVSILKRVSGTCATYATQLCPSEMACVLK